MTSNTHTGLQQHLLDLALQAPVTGICSADVPLQQWTAHRIMCALCHMVKIGKLHKARVRAKHVRYFATASAAEAYAADTRNHLAPPKRPKPPKAPKASQKLLGTLSAKRPQTLAGSTGPADFSRAKRVQCPDFKPVDYSAGAVPCFSAMAIGSYLPSESVLARVWGEL